MRPDAIHLATEGPIGHAVRRYCVKRGLRFTTAYHTSFPEYVTARTGLPVALTPAWMRRFHAPAEAVLVATEGFAKPTLTSEDIAENLDALMNVSEGDVIGTANAVG